MFCHALFHVVQPNPFLENILGERYLLAPIVVKHKVDSIFLDM